MASSDEVTARTFALRLEYDGAGFEGWQVQPGARTVQGELEAAIAQATGASVRVHGSGRTDTGVHAEGQVAHVVLETSLSALSLERALNGIVGRDLAVIEAWEAPAGFHARRDAVSKRYRYQVWNGARRSPLRAARFHHERRPLDLEAMQAAARALVGEHDFRSFQAAGSSVDSTVRTIQQLEGEGTPGAEIRFEVEGSGFLRHMVRNIAGTLLEVGLGQRDPAGMGSLLGARNRDLAGPTAPAHGLVLVAVRYPDDCRGKTES